MKQPYTLDDLKNGVVSEKELLASVNAHERRRKVNIKYEANRGKQKIAPTAKETQLLKAAERVESFQAGLVVVLIIGFFLGMFTLAFKAGSSSGYNDGVRAYQKFERCSLDKDYSGGQVCWDTYMYK
jgi:hypothetical protein